MPDYRHRAPASIAPYHTASWPYHSTQMHGEDQGAGPHHKTPAPLDNVPYLPAQSHVSPRLLHNVDHFGALSHIDHTRPSIYAASNGCHQFHIRLAHIWDRS